MLQEEIDDANENLIIVENPNGGVGTITRGP